MPAHTPGDHFAVNYAGFINMQSGPYYGDTNILDEDKCPDAHANGTLYAAAPDMLKQSIENAAFLQWIADQNFNLWSDKRELLYRRIAETKEAIKKATKPKQL